MKLLPLVMITSLSLGGCDLLSEATTFSVDTEWQYFSVDSKALGLTIPSGSTIPSIVCSAANDICAQSTAELSCSGGSYACSVQCGAGSTCEVSATTIQATDIDLSKKIKSQTEASALSSVTLERIVYNTDENSLTFDTPQLELFVGPQGSAKISDSGVVALGTMPSIAQGTMPNENIQVTAKGKAALTEFVKNYQSPFSLLAKVSLTFASGQPIPQGKLSLKIKAYFQIEPL